MNKRNKSQTKYIQNEHTNEINKDKSARQK